jgi:RNA polymerase sigma-70 factor (ECF subfamily)
MLMVSSRQKRDNAVAAVPGKLLFAGEENNTSAQLMDGNLRDESDSGAATPGGGDDSRGAGAADSELLRRASGGDGRAFRELMDRHADRMFRLAASLVGNSTDAEDVVQESLAGAFRGAGKFKGRSSVKTWLTRIVLTQSAMCLRDRKRRRLRQNETAEQRLVAPENSAGVEAKIDLHSALQRLSAEHREVLVLREFEALSYDEIARLLELPAGTVESRIFRARSELKKLLQDYGS